MNRPLGAFGFLIGGLALAIFAVSSTSRSTGVQKLAAVNRHATFSRSVLVKKTQPGKAAAAVDSVEAASASAFAEDDLCDADSRESRPAEIRLENLQRASGHRSEMKSVRLQVAERTVLSGRTDWAVDCRSHYDRVYDKIVYGESDPELTPPSVNVARKSPPISAGEVTVIFRGLLETPHSAPARPAATEQKTNQKLTRGPSLDAKLHGFIATFGNWLVQWTTLRVESFVGPEWPAARSQALSWAEYGDLIDRAAGSAAKLVAAPTSGDSASVRSSGWLRHSAAATLYQLGLMLEEAGVEIAQGSGR